MPRPRPILEGWDRPPEEGGGEGGGEEDWGVKVGIVDEDVDREVEMVDSDGELVKAVGVAVDPVALLTMLVADAVALLTMLLAVAVSEAIAGMVYGAI